MPLAADFAITVGSKVSYNELAQLSFSVFNNLNPPDLRSDVGGLWENFVIAERMKRNHNQRLFPNCYFRRSRQKQEIDYLEDLYSILTLLRSFLVLLRVNKTASSAASSM